MASARSFRTRPGVSRSLTLALALASGCTGAPYDGVPLVPADDPVGMDAVDALTEATPGTLRAVPGLSLTTSLESGETSFYVVTGATPGEDVNLIYSTSGLGSGPCVPALGGMCLDILGPITLFATVPANANGVATFSAAVPAGVPFGLDVAVQAVIQRGVGGVGSVRTNPRLDTVGGTPRLAPTDGQAIAVTTDSQFAVLANRSANEISVMDLNLAGAPAAGTLDAQFALPGEQPWTSIISNDDDTAFVVLRAAGQVVRINGVRSGAPALDPDRATVDAEPSGIAISPNGTTLFVTNWAAGTVSLVDAQSMVTFGTVDLNAALASSGLLGPSVTGSRPGLAHPWAVVVTDDGDADDDDETVYVTEFFSQDDPSKSFAALGDAYFDEGRQGIVYSFDTATATVNPLISLGSVADTSFLDSAGGTTGCFPNQLAALALNEARNRLYVSSTCASPRGPATGGGANAKTKVHPLLSVIDITTGAELAGERLVLTEQWDQEYTAAGTPDDANRRFPHLIKGMSFFPGTDILYTVAYGANAMFRLEFNPDGSVRQRGSAFNDFVGLSGALPIGISVSPVAKAVVLNESTRNVSFVNLGVQAEESTAAAATAIVPGSLDDRLNLGRRFFVTGLARWSLNGQAWNSCEGCHPSGLTDNVTWFFPAGPRQTVSMDGSFGPGGEQRVFNWTAVRDEVHDFELNTRGISGGVGAMVVDAGLDVANRINFDGNQPAGSFSTDASQVNLVGSTEELQVLGLPGVDDLGGPVTLAPVLPDWEHINEWAETIRAPRAPALDPADVAAGAALFTTHGCNGCHGTDNWTVSERFYTPDQTISGVGGTLETTNYTTGSLPAALNPPAEFGPAPIRDGASINCVLRDVGTFPAAGTVGVAPAGVTVSERKQDMTSTAAGATGINPPSLVGVGAGAPYFHAGNARALEEVLDPTFEPHYRALSAVFTPTPNQIRQLSAYLLSIDDATATHGAVVGGFIDGQICPPSLP